MKQKVTVLVVDDDPNARSTLSQMLELEGYRAVSAADPAGALRMIESEQPSIMLLDTVMPNGDGRDFILKIKALGLSGLRIILYTGQEQAVSTDRATAVGADAYVPKTPDFAYLLEQVRHFSEAA